MHPGPGMPGKHCGTRGLPTMTLGLKADASQTKITCMPAAVSWRGVHRPCSSTLPTVNRPSTRMHWAILQGKKMSPCLFLSCISMTRDSRLP